ncbi:MAG: hypothetical protein RBS39_07380 [Phycisphaerales bacterium]|nr:hypothetical protein [Phycisphaerales bacterium]
MDTADVHPAPPVEELEWRRRALEAEEKLGACEAKIAELEKERDALVEAEAKASRRADIHRELMEEGAHDLEVGCLLTESCLARMDEPDVKAAVADLKRDRPYLFRALELDEGDVSSVGSAMSGAVEHAPHALIGRVADEARESGDRRLLLRYLRMRRGAF